METRVTKTIKESLSLLDVTSSGIRELVLKEPDKSDLEIYNQAIKFSSNEEKISFLKKILESKPGSYVKSMSLLIRLLKIFDPQYACAMVLSLAQYNPIDPKNYLLLAEIAFENDAFEVSLGLLEVSKWLCINEYESELENVLDFLKLVQEKDKNDIYDKSYDEFWRNKKADTYWVLERLFYRSDIKKVCEYSFKLLSDFPSLKNYHNVYRIFSIDTTSANDFIKFLNETKEVNCEYKNLYLGLAHYNLSEIDKSISFLNNTLKENENNIQAKTYLAINYLLKNSVKDFLEIFKKINLQPAPVTLAVYFIYCAITKMKLDGGKFPNEKEISKEIVSVLNKMLSLNQKKNVDHLVNEFINLNYKDILPSLFSNIAQMFIEKKYLIEAKRMFDLCDDAEVYRLYAWIHRIEGNDELAEKLLVKYRKSWRANKESGIFCSLINLDFPEEEKIPSEIKDIFKIIAKAYDDTREIIKEIDSEYGLNPMTCVEVKCQDCCTYTYPYITYIEYLYIENELKKNPELFNSVKDSSIKIIENYKQTYKKEPLFLNKENIKEHEKAYPRDFIFDCPFLGDNKCNIYEVRPFTCRAYSYGSAEGALYKGCNYFFEQLKSATKLNSIRKVINMKSFFEFAGKIDKKLIGKKVAAPIPVWFSLSHEEAVQRIQELKN